MLEWMNPATAALNEIKNAALVRFSLLALSSIFFLVDPFAAIPSFLAITEGVDEARRKRMARKASITCFIVLTSFALAGQLIFKMFGITLPAFEIAGGLILLLIGLDMLQARRSPTQRSSLASGTFAPAIVIASGPPSFSTSRLRFTPFFARSVELGPTLFPP